MYVYIYKTLIFNNFAHTLEVIGRFSVTIVFHMWFGAIWYYLCSLKNVENIHGEVLFLVKLQVFSLQLY